MTLLLLVCLSAFNANGEDCAIVMLSGVPAEPWSSLSSANLEEMWTYGIEGYQITRSGWSGYILRGPEGSAPLLDSICTSLLSDSLVPDSSLWARTLQLVWNSNALPGYTVIEDSLEDIPVMPVRTSRWLAAGTDSLILSLPVENTLLYWTGGYQGDFSPALWRGIGTEVIIAGTVPLTGLASWTMEGSPGDIIDLEYSPAGLDAWWADTWAPLLSMADSIVAAQVSGTPSDQNSLIWIRGTGGAVISPWSFVPSPPPPPVATHEVSGLSGVIPASGTVELPGVLSVAMPGNAGSSANAAYAAALLERIVARMLLPETGSVKGSFSLSGEVVLHFSGVDWSSEEALELIQTELLPIVFTAPETPLMHNAAVRAGIPDMDQRGTIELLSGVTGLIR